MTVDGRVWQFMAGFFAYFLYDSNILNWTNREQNSWKCLKVLKEIVPTSVLVLLLSFDLIDVMGPQLQRVLVIVVTGLVISIRQDDWVLLNSDTLVNLGDASYSIYLVHWPIFVMHRYLDPDTYDDGTKEAGHIGKRVLKIFNSTLFSWKLFNWSVDIAWLFGRKAL